MVDAVFLWWSSAIVLSARRSGDRPKIVPILCGRKFGVKELLVANRQSCYFRKDLHFCVRKVPGNRSEGHGMGHLDGGFVRGLERPFQNNLSHHSGGRSGNVNLGGWRQHGGRGTVPVSRGGKIVRHGSFAEWLISSVASPPASSVGVGP